MQSIFSRRGGTHVASIQGLYEGEVVVSSLLSNVSHSSRQMRQNIRIAQHGETGHRSFPPVLIQKCNKSFISIPSARSKVFFESHNRFGRQEPVCCGKPRERIATGQNRVGQLAAAALDALTYLQAPWILEHILGGAAGFGRVRLLSSSMSRGGTKGFLVGGPSPYFRVRNQQDC